MRFVIIIAGGVVVVVAVLLYSFVLVEQKTAATAAALKLHVKDRFTRRPHTHTHTHTHCVLLGASASVSPCFVGTLFMITELVPIDWWGVWVARVGKSFSPGRASWHANEPYEIINNGLIKRQLTKCVINWFCVQFVWSQISDRHCQMHTKGGGTKARRVVGPALG